MPAGTRPRGRCRRQLVNAPGLHVELDAGEPTRAAARAYWRVIPRVRVGARRFAARSKATENGRLFVTLSGLDDRRASGDVSKNLRLVVPNPRSGCTDLRHRTRSRIVELLALARQWEAQLDRGEIKTRSPRRGRRRVGLGRERRRSARSGTRPLVHRVRAERCGLRRGCRRREGSRGDVERHRRVVPSRGDLSLSRAASRRTDRNGVFREQGHSAPLGAPIYSALPRTSATRTAWT
jgi:hypothetical protein